MAQGVDRRPCTSENNVPSHASRHRVCDGRSDINEILVFPVIVIPLMFYTRLHLQGKLAKPWNLQAKQGIVISMSTGKEGTSVCNIDFFESSNGRERSHAT
jgi:hypothetical protein